MHSSFCSERGEVKGRKLTIGAEVAEDWNFLAIYNGLVVGISEKANELVLQTKTGDPHQLWKFKDGLLMNKTGLVAECKPRGFPKWWQVSPATFKRHGRKEIIEAQCVFVEWREDEQVN